MTHMHLDMHDSRAPELYVPCIKMTNSNDMLLPGLIYAFTISQIRT